MAYKQRSNGLPFKQMASTPVKQNRSQPTYEGTDEYRKEKDIPKKEFKDKGVIHSDEVDLSKKSGFGPSTAFGGVKNPELIKAKKTKSKKVMKDGKKTNVVYKGKIVKGNWQPHQIKK